MADGKRVNSRFKLLRYYSMASAVALTITASVLVALYRSDQVDEFLLSTEADNTRLTTSFANTFWRQFQPFFVSASNIPAEPLRRRGELRALDIAFESLSAGLPILKIRVYDGRGRAIYSSIRAEVGEDFSINPGVRKAVEQGASWTVMTFRPQMPALDGQSADRWVVETGIPVTGELGQVVGALELYSDATPSMDRLRLNVWRLGGLVAAILAGLYLILFLIVRRADRIIRMQHQEVEGAREALRAKEERFRAIADYTFDWESWLDQDGRLRWVNPAVERLAGYSIEQCLAMEDYPLPMIYEGDRAEIRRLRQSALTGNFESGVEFRLVCRNGLVKWVMASFQPIFDDSGAIMGTRWSIHDITDRKRAEQRLRESEVRFRSVTQTAADAIISVNGQGDIVSWNVGAERIFGYAEAEVLGSNVTMILPEAYRQRHEDGLRRAVATGDAPILGVPSLFEGLRRDGQVFPVELTLSRWDMDNGAFFTAILRDVTERKMAEQELAERTAELERSNAELQQFAYVASHDLQEPLRTVTSFLQLLRRRYDGALDDNAREYIHFAADGAARMHRLITDLLVYSRVSTHGRTFEKVKMEAVLDLVLTNLGAAIEEAGAEITRDPMPDVDADQIQMVSLLQNLVGNAIKYRAPGTVPRVHVGAVRDGENWTFSVQDNGIGIDPKYFDRVFVIFQRLHARGEYEGTGIGLAVAKKIVERHGGRIWLESEPGRGSTFHFTLPVCHPRKG
ncbi:PAS domain S-box protein [Magnetospirillum sp. XM-1]|uniref:sensor histidine kinase n=1 Tax=Magnetospirillum sp. XM-1 TaxID=1663591 RepID=UPI0012E38F9E|nr:PAS domain S-box protein [Magnetospirillum sp. XM-1]